MTESKTPVKTNEAATEIVAASSEELVTVLHGYGRLAPQAVHWIDTTKFIGGVARNVPRSLAQKWQEGRTVRNIIILPNDTEDIDFAREAHVAVSTPAQTAASIRAMDVAQLAHELGPEKTKELVKLLQGFLPKEKNS